MLSRSIYVIGANAHGELGLNHTNCIKQLTVIKPVKDHSDHCISCIYSGNLFSIYTDADNKYLLSAGCNDNGQCCIGNCSNSPIQECTQIEYFIKNRIRIHKICVSLCGEQIFWITNDHKLYGNGRNDWEQLGLIAKSKPEPQLVPELENVVDASSADKYNVVLCSNNHTKLKTLLFYWSTLDTVPIDIINVIIKFYEINEVYSTNVYTNGYQTESNNKWNRFKLFNEQSINIIKIQSGAAHTLFLDSNGNVLSWGDNNVGQRGLANIMMARTPIAIQYFMKNCIKIKDIACGPYYNLAIDYNGKVYSWGDNLHGQCGDGRCDTVVHVPKLIKYFQECYIDNIKCGYNHSYCRTIHGEHFLFGSNMNNECITDDRTYVVMTPHCINGIIDYKTNGKVIKYISLGDRNTKLIVADE